MMVKIMVEVVSILGIATKEIEQGRMSGYFLIDIPQLTEQYSEKYLSKLIGKTDMEDALKRLDRLTHEKARMAIAQSLKATHTVDDRVRLVVDRVTSVDARAASINDDVKVINDNVAVAINGAYSIFCRSPKKV